MIFISIGHYPERPGACFEDFCEHGQAANYAGGIMHALGGDIATIVPIGSLRDKIAFINDRAKEDDIAVEIHFNSAKNAQNEHIGNGSECLYYPKSTKGFDLARAIQDELGQLFTPDRGVKEGYYQLNPKKGIDFFLARSICTAVIIEPEFIHHKDKILERREEACKLIAKAITGYVNGE